MRNETTAYYSNSSPGLLSHGNREHARLLGPAAVLGLAAPCHRRRSGRLRQIGQSPFGRRLAINAASSKPPALPGSPSRGLANPALRASRTQPTSGGRRAATGKARPRPATRTVECSECSTAVPFHGRARSPSGAIPGRQGKPRFEEEISTRSQPRRGPTGSTEPAKNIPARLARPPLAPRAAWSSEARTRLTGQHDSDM